MSQEVPTKRERPRTPNSHTTDRIPHLGRIVDSLQPLLPDHPNTHRFGGGRPRVLDRRCADAIFFVLRTGGQWNALDVTEMCARSTAHDRFQEWVQDGVFQRFWRAGVKRFDELHGIEWSRLSLNGAMTKAPLGGGETGANPTDRGKQGVKRSLLIEGMASRLASSSPGPIGMI